MPGTRSASLREVPFRGIYDLQVGDTVRVLSDANAVLAACRAAGIDQTFDAPRRRAVGKEVQVLEKDLDDGTVRCAVPLAGRLWFAAGALTRVCSPEMADEAPEDASANREDGWDELQEATIRQRVAAAFGASVGTTGVLMHVVVQTSSATSEQVAMNFVDALNKALLACAAELNASDQDRVPCGRFFRLLFRMLAIFVHFRFQSSAQTHFQSLADLLLHPGEGLCDLLRGRSLSQLRAGSCAELSAGFQEKAASLKNCLSRAAAVCAAPDKAAAEKAVVSLSRAAAGDMRTEGDGAEWPFVLPFPMTKRYPILKVSLDSATRLLAELRSAYTDPEFQRRYHTIRAEAGDHVGYSVAVQSKILPRYGFGGTVQGVLEMRTHTSFWASADQAVEKLLEDIHRVLAYGTPWTPTSSPPTHAGDAPGARPARPQEKESTEQKGILGGGDDRSSTLTPAVVDIFTAGLDQDATEKSQSVVAASAPERRAGPSHFSVRTSDAGLGEAVDSGGDGLPTAGEPGGKWAVELEVIRRLQPQLGESEEGTPGALLTVEVDAKSKFFCDAVNDCVKRLHKMLVAGDGASVAGAARLWDHVVGVIAVITGLMPLRFHQAPATDSCHQISEQLRGLCDLVRDWLAQGEGRTNMLVEQAVTRMFAGICDLLECLAGLEPHRRRRVWAGLAEVWSEARNRMPSELASADAGADAGGDVCVWLEVVVARRKEYFSFRPRVLRSSPVSITRLLSELRDRFCEDSFQRRYQEIRRDSKLSFDNAHVQCLAMSFSVQSAVIPKYGFLASPRGVAEMREESELLQGGAEGSPVQALSVDIYRALETAPLPRLKTVKHHVPKFHTVGDSHSKNGWPGQVAQHYVGSKLCWNIDHVDLQALGSPPVLEGDALCFCFGEIDCRAHVHKHVKSEGRSYQQVIDDIITRYFAYLKREVPRLPSAVRIFVYNVLPPVRAGVMYHREEVLAYPYQGDDEERRSYVLYFNRRLAAECARIGYVFFDVYDRYADEEGFLRMELSDGGVHIADGAALLDFMSRNLRVGRA